MMEQLMERLRQAGVDVNPAYIENILAMPDQQFGEWFIQQLRGLAGRTAAEFVCHLNSDAADRQGICRLGGSILKGKLQTLLFVLEERTSKFDAIEASG